MKKLLLPMVLLLVPLALAACGEEGDDPSGCQHKIVAQDGTEYCMPKPGSGLALCVVDPAEEYQPCAGLCPPGLGIIYYPVDDGEIWWDADCNCSLPEGCNQVIPDPRR